MRGLGCRYVMSKNKAPARRSGVAVAAMHRNSAGPMRHRLALRGNARTKAESDALDEYEVDADDRYEAYAQD